MRPGTRWGAWVFKCGDGREPALCYHRGHADYWIPLSEIHAPYWFELLSGKRWLRERDRMDLVAALAALRSDYARPTTGIAAGEGAEARSRRLSPAAAEEGR